VAEVVPVLRVEEGHPVRGGTVSIAWHVDTPFEYVLLMLCLLWVIGMMALAGALWLGLSK